MTQHYYDVDGYRIKDPWPGDHALDAVKSSQKGFEDGHGPYALTPAELVYVILAQRHGLIVDPVDDPVPDDAPENARCYYLGHPPVVDRPLFTVPASADGADVTNF